MAPDKSIILFLECWSNKPEYDEAPCCKACNIPLLTPYFCATVLNGTSWINSFRIRALNFEKAELRLSDSNFKWQINDAPKKQNLPIKSSHVRSLFGNCWVGFVTYTTPNSGSERHFINTHYTTNSFPRHGQPFPQHQVMIPVQIRYMLQQLQRSQQVEYVQISFKIKRQTSFLKNGESKKSPNDGKDQTHSGYTNSAIQLSTPQCLNISEHLSLSERMNEKQERRAKPAISFHQLVRRKSEKECFVEDCGSSISVYLMTSGVVLAQLHFGELSILQLDLNCCTKCEQTTKKSLWVCLLTPINKSINQ